MNEKLLNNFLPSAIWIGYHLAIPQWSFSALSLLMLVRAFVILWLFVNRELPILRASYYQIVIAWISTFLPVLMIWDSQDSAQALLGQLTAIGGMVLFIFSALDLGKSFGVSPAVRSPIQSGIYKYLSHPIYFAHIVVEVGILIASPTMWNACIVVVAWSLYILRARWESQILRRYLNESIKISL
ncbi:MAG: isoprenylcysteine carboxylmethyltransferase family protein [Bdellovibrionales bacterium]